jgi:hypothetical protein
MTISLHRLLRLVRAQLGDLMMTMLLIAGIAVLAAGLLAVGLGIPVKEFSFGNTLILAGTIAACTGLVMLGLSMVVRELQNIARRLGPANAAAAPRAGTEQRPLADQPSAKDLLSTRDKPTPENLDGEPSPASAGSPAPWQEEAASRDRGRSRGDVAPEPAPPEPAPAVKPRRNLLFSSSSRKERERGAARTPDTVAADPGPAPPVAPPAPVASEAAPATFEEAWPQSERARSDVLRRSRTPSTFTEPKTAPAPDRHPVAPSEEPPAVTVLKSGVVDGMAYSLYSDGSIEAQMPEGMMRFASIDELRSHLDQRP